MGKTLRSDIIIGGKADGSFYRLGNELQQLGNQVNLVSEKLISFGKEGVETYVNYEDAMLDAKSAWATQYTSVAELNKVMAQAQKASLEWAANSVFTTQDVAEAISEAAHAGWTIEEVMAGVPAAMQIARAGSMGLSEGLEYMIDISHAAGIEFGDLGQLIDTWAYAANRSSTTIPEMGAAMQKMGATMQFVGGDMATLTTMLAVLANNGAKGTEAGTLLRNSFIRLVAPTKAAAEAMDELDITAADLEEIYGETDGLSEASKLLKEYGFQAYDSNGKLKNFLQIYEELNAAMTGMTEQQQNEVLSAIFPTKTITAAKAFVSAAAKGWGGLYNDILNFSAGYAQTASDIMGSGLGYTLEHFESLMDTLKTKTGEAIAPELTTWTNALSGMIENVNNMDSAAFNGLVSGLEVIAAAGPALMTAGAAVKLMSIVFSPTAIGFGAIALGAAAAAAGIESYTMALTEATYQNNFGDLSLDTEPIRQYISEIGSSFEASQKQIDAYNESVTAAVEKYTSSSGELKENLISKMLTGTTLTQEDIEKLNGLGDDMRIALIDGIKGKNAAAKETISGYDNESGLMSDVMDTIEFGYDQAIAVAEAKSKELREAMTSAFADGKLTSSEVDLIQSITDELNEVYAVQLDAANYVERQKQFRNAQILGIEGVNDISKIAEEARAADLARAEDDYWAAVGQTVAGGNWKIKKGITKADGTLYTQDDLDRELAALDSDYNRKRLSVSANADKFQLGLYGTALASSGLLDSFSFLERLAADAILNGEGMVDSNDLYQYSMLDADQRYGVAKFLDSVISAIGGEESVLEKSGYYNDIGDAEMASRFLQLLSMKDVLQALESIETMGLAYSNEEGYQTYINPGYADLSMEEFQPVPLTVIPIVDTASIEEQAESVHPTITVGATVEIDPVLTGRGAKPARRYAEGGRADEASIFGEAGPEWAIPEEHTARTADLLRSAAEASGFTWPELMSSQSSRSAGNWTVVYSPTINAGNAEGVAAKLMEDKDRLLKWLREKAFFEEVEVYA